MGRATEILKEAMGLQAAGQEADALALLRRHLREPGWAPGDTQRAGRLIDRMLQSPAAPEEPLHVRFLGQCTTSWLLPALTAEAWARGQAVSAQEAEYDQVLQDAMSIAAEPLPDVIVLLPWTGRLLADGGRDKQARIADELQFWQQVWGQLQRAGVSRIVQVGYDWTAPGPLGHGLGGADGGAVDLIRTTNATLRDALPPDGIFIDLEQVSGVMGRTQFYDPRRYAWTKQPFSEEGVLCLARHIWAAIRALITGPKKMLVVDLDNTMWGGVVGEVGAHGVEVGESAEGEAYRAFQRHVKGLAERGCLLAVASKNNDVDAKEPFLHNEEMVLSLEDFAAFEASWDPKHEAIRRIADRVNLGLDSFVFFDDSSFERDLVRQMLPEVEVVDVPDDPADFVRALDAGLWFEAHTLTSADRERADQYVVEAERHAASATYESVDDYLRSLELRGDLRTIDDSDLPRVIQLIGKTNQFNLTTRRHSEEVVRQMLTSEGSVGYSLRLQDRFGDYGLIAVLLAVRDETASAHTLYIDTLLMSCRAIGRTAEHYLFNAVCTEAGRLGYEEIRAEFHPTPKNALVESLYDSLGCACEESGEAGKRYRLSLKSAVPGQTFVEPATAKDNE